MQPNCNTGVQKATEQQRTTSCAPGLRIYSTLTPKQYTIYIKPSATVPEQSTLLSISAGTWYQYTATLLLIGAFDARIVSEERQYFPARGELEGVGLQHAVHLGVQGALREQLWVLALDVVQPGLALAVHYHAGQLHKIKRNMNQ